MKNLELQEQQMIKWNYPKKNWKVNENKTKSIFLREKLKIRTDLEQQKKQHDTEHDTEM